MAAKILALFALLALSVSAATAFSFPQYYPSVGAAAAIPLYLPQATAIRAAHPCVQYYAQQQALAAGILAPWAAVIQQPLAILHQQCQAYLAMQSITTLRQQQQLLQYAFNELAMVNPAAYWQQQQLLPNVFNPLALASPAAYLQLPFISGAIF